MELIDQHQLEFLSPLQERWQSQFDDQFLIGQARETAVTLGSNILLYAAPLAHRGEDPIEATVDTLQRFRLGLHQGGMGRSTPKALIGRMISNEAQDFLKSSSYAAYNMAEDLVVIGERLKIFGLRETLFLESAIIGHRSRHRIPRKVAKFMLDKINPAPSS